MCHERYLDGSGRDEGTDVAGASPSAAGEGGMPLAGMRGSCAIHNYYYY